MDGVRKRDYRTKAFMLVPGKYERLEARCAELRHTLRREMLTGYPYPWKMVGWKAEYRDAISQMRLIRSHRNSPYLP